MLYLKALGSWLAATCIEILLIIFVSETWNMIIKRLKFCKGKRKDTYSGNRWYIYSIGRRMGYICANYHARRGQTRWTATIFYKYEICLYEQNPFKCTCMYYYRWVLANVWLMPFSFELIFNKMFPIVDSLSFLNVADFMHWVTIPPGIRSSDICFTKP